jgi:hypothetical protein
MGSVDVRAEEMMTSPLAKPRFSHPRIAFLAVLYIGLFSTFFLPSNNWSIFVMVPLFVLAAAESVYSIMMKAKRRSDGSAGGIGSGYLFSLPIGGTILGLSVVFSIFFPGHTGTLTLEIGVGIFAFYAAVSIWRGIMALPILAKNAPLESQELGKLASQVEKAQPDPAPEGRGHVIRSNG